MRESISYTFLLNIILLFVFVCAAVITGIFSYRRAFKANTIIVNEIEKYEGYNCESSSAIREKLDEVGYNVPFEVECKASYGKPCVTDLNNDYAIVAYNLDYSRPSTLEDVKYEDDARKTPEKNFDDKVAMTMDAYVTNDGQTKIYQYGVYTYMYMDLPVVSGLLRIPIVSRTREMYDFRNLKIYSQYDRGEGNNPVLMIDDDGSAQIMVVDYNIIPDDLKNDVQNGIAVEGSIIGEDKIAYEFARRVLANYVGKNVAHASFEYGYDPDIYGQGKHGSIYVYDMRDAYRYYDSSINGAEDLLKTGAHSCGYKNDWAVF